MNEFSQYVRQRGEGRSPREVYESAKADGVDEIAAIRMLRSVFGLSIVDAKKATLTADVFGMPQTVHVGYIVYWEGSDSIDGPWIMQAKVTEVREGFAYVSDHRKFLVKPEELEEVPATGALVRIPLKYFERSLIDRMTKSVLFWNQLAELSAGATS
ncbi:MAG TPA: hypothetical protein VG056_06810 [Pirellulales bacterium]|jgi:hypothetical protein|nr:hypothetical protein [Pirellulales bacterium]